MSINLKLISGFLVMAVMSVNAYSATVLVEDGELVGADGIVFEGFTASVRFFEGSCAGLFNGCDEPDDLVFDRLTSNNTEAGELAVAANNALLEQVFVANPLYDNNAALTFGCSDGRFVGLTFCGIFSPVILGSGNNVVTSAIQNFDGDTNRTDVVGIGGGFPIERSSIPLDPNAVDSFVYASWDISPVPLPASVWLLLSGIAGFIVYGRVKV